MTNNNYNIFSFIYPDQNDSLSNLTKNELIEFLELLDQYKLEYRPRLSLSERDTFGLEIECEYISNPIVTYDLAQLNLHDTWKVVRDSSLRIGMEAVSPVLCDGQNTWEDVYKICHFLDGESHSVEQAAAHVHVGAHILRNEESFMNFLRLWSTYENIVFRFGYGETSNNRSSITKYAKESSVDYWKKAYSIERFKLSYNEIIELLKGSRYISVNFNNVSRNTNEFKNGNTIEFRCANGTLNPIIWQNLVNLYIRMLHKANDIDPDIIIKRHKMVEKYLGDLSIYNEIFLDQALEFVDLVFDNNLDKIYFLSQYLKRFKVNYDSKKDAHFTRILTKTN